MKTFKSSALAALALMLGACGQQVVEFAPAQLPPDLTAPTVVSNIPLGGAVGVLASVHPSASFSEAMAPATVNGTSFTLARGGTPVAGAVSLDAAGITTTFVPTAPLALNTLYTATITTAVTDTSGNAMAAAHAWSFTTAVAADTTAPTVVSNTPLAGATGVLTSVQPTVTFSEPMATASVSAATFTLARGGTAVPGGVSLNVAGTTATLAPTSALATNTLYTATVSVGVTDVAGNPLAAVHAWSFTTAVAADTTPPTVVSNTPLTGAVGVLTNVQPTATFSEPMALATINASTITLAQGLTPVLGAVSLNLAGTTATFAPTAALATNTLYTGTVTTGVTDLASNPLAVAHTWSFTTALAPIAPTVTATDPLDLAVTVPVTKQPTATFSTAMATNTIDSTTFLLAQGLTPVPGAVSLNLAGTTATFAPTSALATNTLYTATITTGAKDLAGTPLASDHVWTFTTAVAAVAPTVTVTNPLDLATNVLVSVQPTAAFSKPMDGTTISGTTYTLKQGAASVAGNVTFDVLSNTATFTPTAALATNTLYAATVTTGVRDTTGMALASDHVWTFTTELPVLPPPLAINLGAAASFGIASRAGLTSTGVTVVNGDVALYPTGTCTDATGGPGSAAQSCLVKTYVTTTGMTVNGFIYWPTDSDSGATALAVTTDLTAAWIEGKAKADTNGAIAADEMAGKIFTPGVYHNANLGLAAGGTATLDAQGDANAIFIFKIDSTFVDSGTLLLPTSIALLNGAQARNVWFVAGLDITIGSGTSWKGNILAGQTATVLDGSTVLGRVLAGAGGAGAITLTGAASPSVTTITVP
jgi:hypothetical protein